MRSMRGLHPGGVAAILAVAALPSTSAASDAAAGLAPVAAIPAVGVIGGSITTVLLAQQIGEPESVHPALRNIAFGFAGINVLFGAGGLVAVALVGDDDFEPVGYSLSGAVLALGLVGGGLAWATDPWTPRDEAAGLSVVAGPDGAHAAWTGRF